MNIILTEHLQNFVERKVGTGGYTDASEVIREALRLLEQTRPTEPADLDDLIAEADDEVSTPMTAEDWANLRAVAKNTATASA